jgi:acyl dehydratase
MSLEHAPRRRLRALPYRRIPRRSAEYAPRSVQPVRPDLRTASIAGALLFVVAPHLLADPRAGDSTRSVIHGDQTFRWTGAYPLGTELQVTGRWSPGCGSGTGSSSRLRTRVNDRQGPILAGTSTFLMSGRTSRPAGGGAERREPAPTAGSCAKSRDPSTRSVRSLGRFAASRADLVRYAGASRDWNPIHWDHAAAVAAGLPGVVVHGLLQSAWVIEAAGLRDGVPPKSARFRYRRPLAAGSPWRLGRTAEGRGSTFELTDDEGPFLTATVD